MICKCCGSTEFDTNGNCAYCGSFDKDCYNKKIINVEFKKDTPKESIAQVMHRLKDALNIPEAVYVPMYGDVEGRISIINV